MAKSTTFLAYREAGEKLRFYTEDPQSSWVFHFSAFADGEDFEIPMREIPSLPNIEYHFSEPQKDIAKEDQIQVLEKAIQALQNGEGDKVVISRIKLVEHASSPEVLLRALDQAYPLATVYLFVHPKAGVWIGASPENLAQLKEGTLKTASLAGTRRWTERDSFAPKEYEEQAIVTEEICSRLAQIGIKNIHCSEVALKQAGHLAHLYTEISAAVPSVISPKKIAKHLHPTPAVGGFPREWSANFIREQELYHRRYYTGFFGWTDSKTGQGQFWVNLRCGEYFGLHTLGLYVGGGITAHSDAESEWQETEHKAETILGLLK